MSSHHFVKEGQEPALFITEALALAFIEPLLEWAPLVMVTDSVLDDAIRWGFKVDVVIVQKDHLEITEEKMADQIPFKIVMYEEGDNLVSIGLDFLSSQKQSAVHIISSADIFLVVHNFVNRLDVTILNEELRWSFSRHATYEKWLPANTRLRLKRTTGSQTLTIHQLNEVDSEILEVTKDGIARIKSDNPFWVGEY